MPETLIYREASIDEIDALKELRLLSYGQFKEVLAPIHWEKQKRLLEDDAALKELIEKSTLFVCVDERIVGMACLMPSGNPTHIFETGWSHIRMVGVDPEYRGRGIAKQLTQNCIDHARQSGETIVALHTSEYMDPARHIYESMGFRVVREIDPLYGQRYWLYKLDL